MKFCLICCTWYSEADEACPGCAAEAPAVVFDEAGDRAGELFLAAVAAVGLAMVAFAVWT